MARFKNLSHAGLLACAAMLAGNTTLACVIDSPICTTPSTGREAVYLGPMPENVDPTTGSFVIFEDDVADDDGQDLVLVNCQSADSLIISARQYEREGHWVASDMMQAAIDSPDVIPLRELRNQLKAAGYDSRVGTLPSDHCACDADRPAPAVGCSDNGP